jgi:hypothetical protein
MRNPFARTALAVLTLFAMLVQGTWVLAGTTGGLSGMVTDASTGKPVAGATVTASSPTQTAKVAADQNGRYGFVSLAPDTYTLTVASPGYQPFSQQGITVIADQTLSFNFAPAKTSIQEIGRTRSRSSTDLVKPGQTADVYSISGQLSQNSQALGGGGALFQTYAALASVPGVYVPQGSNFGPNNASPYIRGGDYNQVGFEYDGIPVNRAFDNYVSNTQGITGQQELQVYTGGVPAGSSGEGLSGYINQVIKSGTYPATANAEGLLGTPTFYHYLRGEFGGASSNRAFSYYLGSTGWNQSYRYGNGDNNLPSPQFQPLYATFDGTGGAVAYPYNIGAPAYQSTRETVANLHFGIPHRGGDGRDDIQLLGSVGRTFFKVYDSINDTGGCASPFNAQVNGFASCNDVLMYPTGVKQVYTGPLFHGVDPTKIQPYFYPAVSGATLQPGDGTRLNPDFRGGDENNNGIFKFQYQKNFGSSAYVRLYGYSNYSSWFIYDPVGFYYAPATAGGALDYELDTHTRGVSLEFADQLNAHHLLQGSASFTFANVVRANNTTSFQPGNPGFRIQLRDGNQNCYSPTTGALANCYSAAPGSTSMTGGINATQFGTTGLTPIVGAAAAAGAAYQVVNSGYSVTLNQVSPKFSSFSLSDAWQVTDKLKLDAGLRFNRYLYGLVDTGQQAIVGGANTPNFTAFNNEHCYDTATRTIVHVNPGAACPAGTQHVNLSNVYPSNVDASVLEPRLGGTYTMSPYDVIRFSAGKYSQPSNSAFVQYNNAGDLAAFTASHFFPFGFNTPRHDTGPQLSYNYDLSYEKRLKNAPLSLSFTPFFRRTQQQQQQFFIDARSAFVSGLNVGTLRAFGYELLTRYGDFNRDGWSGQLSFAYTNSKIKYANFAGTSLNMIDQINNSVLPAYNRLTSAGGGSPCYDQTTGTGLGLAGGACPAGSNANPYFSMPLQAGLDRNGYFSPYDVVPTAAAGAAAAGSSNSYEIPYVLTGILQYRKNGWRVVPTLQYDSGPRYGSPLAWYGYDPSSGAGCTTANTAGTCGAVFRPNPYTGRYDSLGEFRNPSTLTISMQVAKDLSRRVTATAILTNLYRHCFTHGYAWETGGSQACGYLYNADMVPGISGGAFLGNGTGPTATNFLQHDPYGYAPAGGPVPFNAFISLQVKM